MARSGQPKFLLGIVDEPIAEKSGSPKCNETSSKIGGIADHLGSYLPEPRCRVCNRDQALVVQIYAPRDSQFHRILYVYGCVRRPCWNNSNSWTVVRCQRLLDLQRAVVSCADTSTANRPTEWLENADVWGDEEDMEPEEDPEGNLKPGRPRQGPSKIEWDRRDADRDVGSGGDSDGSSSSSSCIPPPTNILLNEYSHTEENRTTVVSNRALDEQGNNANLYRVAGAESPVIENFRKLGLGEGGNGVPVEGAVGIDHGNEAFAEVEPPDEGTITLETPTSPARESLEALFGPKPSTPIPKGVRPQLKSWFLAVVEEPPLELSATFSDHERELLMQYQRQEGLNINELCNVGNSLCTESYEKVTPRHGNRIFCKFQARVMLCPDQLIRYSCDPEGYAIPIAALSPEDADAGRCQNCGAERGFELQLMPTLVDFLRIEGEKDPVIEFGTVIIYTCKASCWSDGETFREERVVVQPDPDNALFILMENQRNVYASPASV